MSISPAEDATPTEHGPAVGAMNGGAMDFARTDAGRSLSKRRIRKNACSGDRSGRLAARR